MKMVTSIIPMFLLLLMVMPSLVNADCTAHVPAGIQYCIGVNIVSGNAISANTPLITNSFDAGKYSFYFSNAVEANNLQNLVIYNSLSGNIVYGSNWGNSLNFQQTGTMNTINSLELVIGGLPAFTTYNDLAIGFYPTNTNNYNALSTWGASPQLWCASGCPATIYNGVDNGAFFYNPYFNFAGTATPSGWEVGSATINNGIFVPSGFFSNSFAQYGLDPNYLVEGLGTMVNPSAGSTDGAVGYVGVGSGAVSYEAGWTIFTHGDTNARPITWKQAVGEATGGLAPASASVLHYYSTYFPDQANVITGFDFATFNTLTGTTFTSSSKLNIGFDSRVVSGASFDFNTIGQRQIPTNNIMPTVTFGALIPIISVSLSVSPNPVTYPATSTATATCQSGDTCHVDFLTLGNTVATGTTTAVWNIPTLKIGSYSIYGNDITTATTTSPATYTVNAAATIIACTFNGAAVTNGVTYNTLDANDIIQCTATSNNNEVQNGNLIKAGTVVAGASNVVTYNAVWNNLNTVYVFNTLASGNYLANSITFNINSIPYTFVSVAANATAYETTTQGYSWKYNITKAAASANVIFAINNIVQNNIVAGVLTGAGSAQTFNFIYNVARLSSNNIVFTANTGFIFAMKDGNTLTFNNANTISQTEYEAIPIILGAANTFADSGITITANLVVPAVLNRQENIYRNGVLYTSGVSSVVFSTSSWTAGTYTVNALDTVALRNATATFTVHAVAVGQCGIVPPPYYTSGNVAAIGGVVNNVLIMNVTSETNFQHVANIINASGHITIAGTTYNGANLGFTNTVNWNSGTFCINLVSGSNENVNITGEFNYQTNAIPRNYQYNNTMIASNTLKTINVLTINSLTGINVGQFNIYVINPTLTQIATYVQIFKYYPNTNNYQLVDFIKTGTTGQTQAYLENSKFYTFNIYDANLKLLGVISSINGNPLYCITNGGCSTQLQLPQNQSTSFTNFGYIQKSCTYTNLTKTLSCAVTDPTSSTAGYLLNVTKNGILGAIGICNSRFTGASGVLTCTLPDNTSTYIYRLYANTGTSLYQIQTGTITFAGVSQFGTLGYFLFFLILLVFTLVGIEHPVYILILNTAGIIITYLIGLISLTLPLIVDAIIILLILAYKLKR